MQYTEHVNLQILIRHSSYHGLTMNALVFISVSYSYKIMIMEKYCYLTAIFKCINLKQCTDEHLFFYPQLLRSTSCLSLVLVLVLQYYCIVWILFYFFLSFCLKCYLNNVLKVSACWLQIIFNFKRLIVLEPSSHSRLQ